MPLYVEIIQRNTRPAGHEPAVAKTGTVSHTRLRDDYAAGAVALRQLHVHAARDVLYVRLLLI